MYFEFVGATIGRPRAFIERPYGGADLHSVPRARDRMKNVTQDSGPKFAPIYRIPSCGVGANSGKRKRLRRSEYTTHKQKRRTALVLFCVFGWGSRIRTYECQSQSLVPYRLAIPQYAVLKSTLQLYHMFLAMSRLFFRHFSCFFAFSKRFVPNIWLLIDKHRFFVYNRTVVSKLYFILERFKTL